LYQFAALTPLQTGNLQKLLGSKQPVRKEASAGDVSRKGGGSFGF
jgi:hypothetical protein